MAKALQDYVNSLVKFVESDPGYQERNLRIDQQNERRYCQKKPQVPEEYAVTSTDFRSPFIFDVLRRAPGLTSTKMPTPRVLPIKTGSKAQDNSTLREQWLKGAYRRMERGTPIYHLIMDSLSGDGCAIWKCILDKHLWAAPDREDGESDTEYLERTGEHRRANFPFYWEHVPAKTFFPIPNESNPYAEVLIITQQSGAALAKRYGLSVMNGKWVKGKKGEIPVGEAKFVEYWGETEWCYMVEGIIVKQGEHEYGKPPFFVAPLTVTTDEPAKQFYGLAWPMMYLQDTLDSLITAQLNHVMLNSFPYPALEPLGDQAIPLEGDEAVVKLKRGEPYIPPPGYRLVWLQAPNVGSDLTHMRNMIKEVLDQVGLAPVLFGNFPGDTSGTAANTMVAVAKSIFGPGLVNVARAFDEMAGFMQRMVEKIAKKPEDAIPVYYAADGKDESSGFIELYAKDVAGYYDVQHTLDPVLPAEQNLKYMYLADANVRGLVPKRHVIEEGMQIANPEDMLDEVWVEEAEKLPQVQNIILQEALKPYTSSAANPGGGNPLAALMGANPLGGAPIGNAGPANTGTPKNMPAAAGGPGASVAAGINQPMQPGQRMASRPPGVGRG